MFTPILFSPIENNPYFWWNGLEIPVQLKYLFDMVMRHEATIDELVKAVNDLYAELETTIKKEVVDTINEMYENGELESILLKASKEYFEKIEQYSVKTSQLDMRRVWRECYRVGTNDRRTRLGKRPAGVQSGTMLTYNGSRYLAVGLTGGADYSNTGDSSTQHYNRPNAGVLQLWKYDRPDAIELAGQICFNAGHFGCMDYNEADNYFYIGVLSDTDGASNKIIRINILNVLNQNVNVTDFCFLPFIEDSDIRIETMLLTVPRQAPYDDGRGIGTISCSTGEANTFYSGQYARLYKCTWNVTNVSEDDRIVTDSLVNEIEDNVHAYENLTSHNKMAYANMSVTSDFIYIAFTYPNIVLRANRQTQHIDWIYNIKRLLNDNRYVGGENEGLKVFDNGDMYLFTYTNMCNSDQLKMGQCFYQNLKNNIAIPINPFSYNSNTLTVYVDDSIVTHNPSGTESNPFNNLLECVFWAQTQTQYNNIRIKIRNVTNPYFLNICSRASLSFESDKYEDNTLLMVTIGGVDIRGNGGYISFTDCVFSFSYLTKNGMNANLNISRSVVTLIRCAYRNIASDIDIKTANYIRGGMLILSSDINTSGLPSYTPYWNQSEWEGIGSGYKFINTAYAPVFSGNKNTPTGSTPEWIFN